MQRTSTKSVTAPRNWSSAVKSAPLDVLMPKGILEACPIQVSSRVLGRKWAMLVLRDIGFRKIDRFTKLLESIPGLTPRVLSMRLKELEEDGYIKKADAKTPFAATRWEMTDKGIDSLQILLMVIAFGSKWHADEVFYDKKPRKLDDLFKQEALELMKHQI